jgi:hypothetical protein
MRLEAIGVTQLQDLAERDPYQLVHEINIAAGRPIWHPPIATQAMTNLIAAARQEPSADSACVRRRRPEQPPRERSDTSIGIARN